MPQVALGDGRKICLGDGWFLPLHARSLPLFVEQA